MEKSKIEILDLEPIMVKIMDKDEGLGWSLVYTKTVTEEYRRYLTMCLENPESAIVPAKPIDEFWHFHILDTLKYQEDCENIFGYFLHHFPYFGMRGEEDKNNLDNAWEETLLTYKNTFGEKVNATIWLSSARCPNCGRKVEESTLFMNNRPNLSSVA